MAFRSGVHVANRYEKYLLMQWFALVFFLVMATLVTQPGSSRSGDYTTGRMFRKGTGLALLYIVLGVMSNGPKEMGQVAVGIGSLVTVAYLTLSKESSDLLQAFTDLTGKALQTTQSGQGG